MKTVKYRQSKLGEINAFNKSGREVYDSVMLARDRLKKNFAAQNFDAVATYAYVNYSVIGEGRAHKNPAWPIHFNSLFYHYSFIRLGEVVRRHPRSRASGC
jgi:hypothetical protein